jgi:glycosyltransferase involved in cell wall biosynthesis
MPIKNAKSGPLILYVVTEDWYFLLHRLPMAQAAARAGYRVHVATRVNKDRRTIEALGYEVHPVDWRRGSLNPVDNISTLIDLRRLYDRLKPDVVHHVALQPVVIGSLASSGLRLTQLDSLVGLGAVFASPTFKARVVRTALGILLPHLMNRAATTVTVENADDKAELSALGVRSERISVLPGSGVDIHRLQPLPEPAEPVTAAFVGRLLENKGLRTLLAARDLLANRGTELRLLIAGEPDPANPSSIPAEEIEGWKVRTGITMLGFVSEISDVWRSAHFAVLPSRGGEGLPVSLLEAAACGRPLVATDVPGCREIARSDLNALLVSPDDPSVLAEAMSRMAKDSEMRRRFGRASRQIVETEYSSDIVGREVVALYDRLSGRQHPV